VVNLWVELRINPRFNPGADDRIGSEEDHGAMTITDYLINAIFVLVVLRQARERELDRRSIVVPLILAFFVAQMYLYSIPTAGNDPVLIGLLAAVGLTLGIASGFATHVRAGDNGLAVAHVGWLAATLLIAGIGSRMVFAFAVSYGLRSDLASFSIAHHILRHRLADRAGADGDLRSHHQDRNRAATRPQRDQRPDGHGRIPATD